MPYEDKIMVASGDSEHPGEEEVSFEIIPRSTVEGHTYDLEFNQSKDEVTLTEDGSDKTTLPLAATFVGTTAEWEALSALEKANYRLVNFTEDGGIGDASNAVVAFTSSDVADGNANDWTPVTPIVTGLNLKTLWERASMMFKNVRYLFKILGTTDISSIGDGTVTGIISTLNSYLTEIKTTVCSVTQGLTAQTNEIIKNNKTIYLSLNISTFTPTTTGWVTLGSIPTGYRPYNEHNIVIYDNLSNTTKPLIVRILKNGTINIWITDTSVGINPYISTTFITA